MALRSISVRDLATRRHFVRRDDLRLPSDPQGAEEGGAFGARPQHPLLAANHNQLADDSVGLS